MNLGTNFRKIRNLKGFSEEYVAHKLKMSQPSYSKYELDRTKPTWDFIERFAQIHEVDPFKVVAWGDSYVFNNHHQQGGNAANIIIDEKNDKLLEAKDDLIREKDEVIKAKNEAIAAKNLLIKALESKLEGA